MKKRTRFTLLFVWTILQFSTVCGSPYGSTVMQDTWTADGAWYLSRDTIYPDRPDIFYLVSTNVISTTDSNGREMYRAQLNAADRQVLHAEMAYVEEHIAQRDCNFFAPYYHQFTFNAISLPDSLFQAEYRKVAEEVCRAFDHYITHMNQGRRFVLVGFSQGAMLVLDLLRHMTDAQYSRMVAAYTLGYRLTAEDRQCRRIIPATDEITPGVTVSFNSVLSREGRWPLVAEDAANSINPVNWKTDSTAATFTYEGSRHTVRLDPDTHLLIVETDKADAYRQWNGNPVFRSAGVHPDCLHHWDLLFYTPFIHDNILQRAKRLTK